MDQTAIIAALAVAFFVMLILGFIFRKSGSASSQLHDSDFAGGRSGSSGGRSLAQAQRGDLLRIESRALPESSIHLEIDRIDGYVQGSDQWQEFSGVHRGRRLFVEQGERSLPMICIADGIPLHALDLDPEDLADDELRCEFHGEHFVCTEMSEAVFYEDEDGDGELFTYWDLSNRDGSQTLTIEAWSGEQPTASQSVQVDSLEVESGD